MIDMNVLTAWMFSVLTAIAPQPTSYGSANMETPEERTQRFESIARDIVTVVYDEKETSPFQGKNAKEISAVFIATYAAYESGNYAPDVEKGKLRGDRGRSWCMMQLNIGGGKTPEGWTGKDLIEDRKKCIAAGYHVMQKSMETCKGDERDGLAAYVSGNCKWGVWLARKRYDVAMKIYEKFSLNRYLRRLEKAKKPAEKQASL